MCRVLLLFKLQDDKKMLRIKLTNSLASCQSKNLNFVKRRSIVHHSRSPCFCCMHRCCVTLVIPQNVMPEFISTNLKVVFEMEKYKMIKNVNSDSAFQKLNILNTVGSHSILKQGRQYKQYLKWFLKSYTKENHYCIVNEWLFCNKIVKIPYFF